ncbi:unnamed protein product [Agarophyton chilense]
MDLSFVPATIDGERFLYFAYGTLKCGFPNEAQIPNSVTFVGQASTIYAFPLVVETDYNIPFMIDYANFEGSKRVSGELLIADKEAKEKLDQFEGVDTGFYIVKSIAVKINDVSKAYRGELSVGQTVSANAYFRHPSNKGPSWAHEWTIERLLTLPFTDSYTYEMSKSYIKRTHRVEEEKNNTA